MGRGSCIRTNSCRRLQEGYTTHLSFTCLAHAPKEVVGHPPDFTAWPVVVHVRSWAGDHTRPRRSLLVLGSEEQRMHSAVNVMCAWSAVGDPVMNSCILVQVEGGCSQQRFKAIIATHLQASCLGLEQDRSL